MPVLFSHLSSSSYLSKRFKLLVWRLWRHSLGYFYRMPPQVLCFCIFLDVKDWVGWSGTALPLTYQGSVFLFLITHLFINGFCLFVCFHFQRVFRLISVVLSNLIKPLMTHSLAGSTSMAVKQPALSIRRPRPKAETEPNHAWQNQQIMTNFI